MNVSDSLKGHGVYPQQQTNQSSVAGEHKTKSTSNSETAKANRLDALKAKMKAGEPVNLNSLADSMMGKGSVFDVQA